MKRYDFNLVFRQEAEGCGDIAVTRVEVNDGSYVKFTDHEAELKKKDEAVQGLVEALKKIANEDPKDYEPGAEYWAWGNYDDCYHYGRNSMSAEHAELARAALAQMEGR